MTRKEKILHLIDTRKPGIEIGPFYTPIAQKHDGCNVQIIDHLSRDSLVALYGHAEEIEEVDFVWDGQTYSELTGKTSYYAWIIASHVIEHVPDFIWFLNNCESIITADGILSLVIPDKRFCFDCFRPISGIGKVIDAYYYSNVQHSYGTAAEYWMNVSNLNGGICWSSGTRGVQSLVHPDALDLLKEFDRQDRRERDFHAWVFTPSSFRLMIHDLNLLGFTGLHEVAYYPTEGCEFFVALSRAGEAPKFDRLEWLKRIHDEQRGDVL